MNRHEFQQLAKRFRAGKVTLEEFAESVFPVSADNTGQRQSAARSLPSIPPSKGISPRPQNAHKGDFGRVLCIGGSEGMAGAISLCGMAALRCGSGLVKVAVPAAIKQVVAQFSPCYMTVPLPDAAGLISEQSGALLAEQLSWADVIAVGPGMGQSGALQELMQRLYTDVPQPMVIDADGLNNLAAARVTLGQHAGLRILTPHPGEFRRMVPGATTDRNELEKRAEHLALENDLTIVLKGHRTLVTNGDARWHNQTGNPGMATGGSGDVLTGMITSLLGQGLDPLEASKLAVEIHGTAGDLAAQSKGEVSMISTDLLEFIPAAFIQ